MPKKSSLTDVSSKPLLPGMKVSDCLREFQTGGLRRNPHGTPFEDVISSERTPQREREVADHPSLKPQSLLRQLVYAALPLGVEFVCDTFSGSGSTVAACEAVGIEGIGIERHIDYFEMSRSTAPKLAGIESSLDRTSQLTLGMEID